MHPSVVSGMSDLITEFKAFSAFFVARILFSFSFIFLFVKVRRFAFLMSLPYSAKYSFWRAARAAAFYAANISQVAELS